MAFLRSALEAVGGFDVQFRVAGDDVDICWRLQERGWKLGFSPSAQVWHHRRNSVKAYLKQQMNYGKAEAMLEKKWPEKYNAAGHIPWAGRLICLAPSRWCIPISSRAAPLSSVGSTRSITVWTITRIPADTCSHART